MIPAAALLVLSAAVPASLSYADPPAPAPARPARMIRLHRIDPRTVRADFERADFIVEGQSGLMRNAADDHNQLD